jgi:YVTN family beta-propeller protein
VKAASRAILLLTALGAFSSARGQYVEDSIDVGGNFVGSMAYNPYADVVYGRSNTGDFVFAIDCATNTVIGSIPVDYPLYMAFSAVSNKLYCPFTYGRDSVLIVDGATHQRLRAIRVRGANMAVWDSASNRVCVSCDDQWDVKVIDCVTDSVIATIRVGDGPLKMHINTRRRKLYVQNWDSEDLSIIDLQTNEVIRTLSVGEPLVSGWYSASLDKYICGGYTHVFTVGGGTDTLRSVFTLDDPGKIWSIAGDDASGFAFLGSEGLAQNALLTFDTVAETVVAQEVMPGVPRFVFRSDLTSQVYVLCRNGWVSVCGPDGRPTGCSLAVQSSPFVAAYSPPTRRLYIGHLNSPLVYVIKDTVTGLAEGRTGLPARSVGATVVRGALDLPASGVMRQASSVLLDAAGRRVAGLRPGRNDLSRLSPGVYFVREQHDSRPMQLVIVH